MQLRRADVLEGALALLDEDGLEGLTMRRLAARLDVQAGALYWHFANKQALLDAMADKVVEGLGAALPPGPWDEQVAAFAHRLRDALLAHRDGARMLAGTFVTESNTVAAGRIAVDILCRAGLPAEQAGMTAFAMMHYVLGHTIEEQAQADPAIASAWEAKRDALLQQDSAAYLRALGAAVDAAPEEQFACGLGLFLDGLRYRLSVPR